MNTVPLDWSHMVQSCVYFLGIAYMISTLVFLRAGMLMSDDIDGMSPKRLALEIISQDAVVIIRRFSVVILMLAVTIDRIYGSNSNAIHHLQYLLVGMLIYTAEFLSAIYLEAPRVTFNRRLEEPSHPLQG